MKILFVHNKYGKVSGEELMIERIMALLEARGHQVATHFAESASIQTTGDKIAAAASGIWSGASRRALRARMAEVQPDLVQIQNLYPLISPSVLPVIAESGVPIVMRLANYRLICPTGLFLSDGKVCERCRGGREWHCVTRNCEDSLFKSTGYALRNASARMAGFYTKHVTRYYAQSAFQRGVHVREGFAADRVDVIPNMIDTPEGAPDWAPGGFIGFAGRLSAEKGVDTIFEAARHCPDIPFRFAGDPGVYADRDDIPDNVTLLGRLERPALAAFYEQAAAVLVPSIWYEGFPSIIIEAMRHARPVIVSDIGGLPEIIDPDVTGLAVPPGDARALAQAVQALWQDPDRRRALGEAGFARVRDQFSPDRYYDRLMTTYDAALTRG